MAYYSVVECTISDPAWVEAYVPAVTELVTAQGGKYLARTMAVEQLEGDGPAPQVLVLIEWPSKEASDAFYKSDAYKPFLESRLAGTTGHHAVAFTDDDISG